MNAKLIIGTVVAALTITAIPSLASAQGHSSTVTNHTRPAIQAGGANQPVLGGTPGWRGEYGNPYDRQLSDRD